MSIFDGDDARYNFPIYTEKKDMCGQHENTIEGTKIWRLDIEDLYSELFVSREKAIAYLVGTVMPEKGWKLQEGWTIEQLFNEGETAVEDDFCYFDVTLIEQEIR